MKRQTTSGISSTAYTSRVLATAWPVDSREVRKTVVVPVQQLACGERPICHKGNGDAALLTVAAVGDNVEPATYQGYTNIGTKSHRGLRRGYLRDGDGFRGHRFGGGGFANRRFFRPGFRGHRFGGHRLRKRRFFGRGFGGWHGRRWNKGYRS